MTQTIAPATPPAYLTDHGAAIEEIGTLATLLADILSGPPLREVALRIAAQQPSVQRAVALLGCGCGLDEEVGCPCGCG